MGKKMALWQLSRLDPYTLDKDIDLKGIPENKIESELKRILRKFK